MFIVAFPTTNRTLIRPLSSFLSLSLSDHVFFSCLPHWSFTASPRSWERGGSSLLFRISEMAYRRGIFYRSSDRFLLENLKNRRNQWRGQHGRSFRATWLSKSIRWMFFLRRGLKNQTLITNYNLFSRYYIELSIPILLLCDYIYL